MRDVSWDQGFYDEAKALTGVSDQVLDEALRGVEWALSNFPERGKESRYPGVLVRRVRLPRANRRVVRVSLFYIYDDEKVFVLSIKRWPPKDKPQVL